jgi:serine/threonine-protein kinase
MLPDGTELIGKWTGTRFYVERKLGEGANGQVYLVRTPDGRAAMKVCHRSSDIALEWGLLERLSAVNQVFPKPFFIDDAPPGHYFYVMEWVAGKPFEHVAPTLQPDLLHAAVRQLLQALVELHARNYAFCDIKPENILVAVHPTLSVRFVDVGGVTPFGRSVRQFTPFYDRGFWGLGSRKAEAAYDLSALALTVLFLRQRPPEALLARTPNERRQWLWRTVKKFEYPQYVPVISRVLLGQVRTSQQMLDEWTAAQALTPSLVPAQRKTGMDWTEWLMWTSICSAATVTLVAWASFFGWV